MSNPRWTSEELGDLTGRVVIVTGANSGIGLEAAQELARHGAQTILAVRDPVRGEEAAAAIRSAAPEAAVRVMALDLADLTSVRAFADAFLADHDRLDLLVNNAGVMMPPKSTTADGFELQFGTNHLGHFALTGLLLERLMATSGSRVVTVASQAHRSGTIDFDDLQWEGRPYRKMASYGQSKLANLLFTFELQRRREAARAATKARGPPPPAHGVIAGAAPVGRGRGHHRRGRPPGMDGHQPAAHGGHRAGAQSPVRDGTLAGSPPHAVRRGRRGR